MSRCLRIALALAILVFGASSIAVTQPARANAEYIYWANQSDGTIMRAEADGSNPEPWITGRVNATELALHGGHLYWTQNDGIYRAPTDDATAITQIVAASDYQGLSYGLAVNDTHVYWTPLGFSGIFRANIDGTGTSQIISVAAPQGLALSATHLYFARTTTVGPSFTGTITRSDLDGNNSTDLVSTGSGAVDALDDLAISDTHMYWTKSDAGIIGRAKLDGTEQSLSFLRDIGQAYALAVTDSFLFWTTFSTSGAISSGIWKSSLDGSDRQRIVSTGTGPIGIAARDSAFPSPQAGSTSTSFADFSFFLPDGRECTSISPQRVQVGTMVELPGVDALCKTMPGSSVAGWTIPVPPGFTGYGSPTEPFPPGLRVRVIESQRFTVVPFDPVIQIDYDANIAADHSCTPTDVAHSADDGRVAHVWVPRADFAMARTAMTAPCVPSGYELVGWNTAGDGSGTTLGRGAELPDSWESQALNHRTLYAMWRLV